MKTKMILPLLALLVCSCGSSSKEIEVKEKVIADNEMYAPGTEFFSLVPESTVLSWDKDGATKSGFKQLNVTVKIRLDQQPDTVKYILSEYKGMGVIIYLTDINGQYFDGSQFASTQIPLPLSPGLSLVDTDTENAKIRDLLASKPGTVAEVTFAGVVQKDYIDNLAEHVTSCVASCMIPFYDKNPRRH